MMYGFTALGGSNGNRREFQGAVLTFRVGDVAHHSKYRADTQACHVMSFNSLGGADRGIGSPFVRRAGNRAGRCWQKAEFLESEGSLDHTSIEEFRNRFGTKGAQLITADMMKVAKEFGFTKGDDVDMDSTVQEAGITHPTEMKLMGHLMRRLGKLHQEIKKVGQKGIQGIGNILKGFSKVSVEYRFFAKTREKKVALTKKAVELSGEALLALSNILPGTKSFDALKGRHQEEILNACLESAITRLVVARNYSVFSTETTLRWRFLGKH
ncbi:MAG: hypothetical protein HY537_02820 [Deltaproteobacteria bacterium]|nr:hypothetical protein [Deltaproteobacteria bacterium]